MKKNLIILPCLVISCSINAQTEKSTLNLKKTFSMEIVKTPSHISQLNIAISHLAPETPSKDYPILFLHGSSFPSSLSFGFEMNNSSWMKNLSENGYDVYALDFLGYGNSDRYPEMKQKSSIVVGRAVDVYKDVEEATNYILEKTGKNKLYLLGHSWGGSVAALYASTVPDKIEKLVLFATITVKNEDSEIEETNSSIEEMSPSQRIKAMKSLTPLNEECQLEPEIFEKWGEIWRKSDPLALNLKDSIVRYPSGPSADVQDLLHNIPYYDPKKITAQTLVIRGEWDEYPNNGDAESLFRSLDSAKSKKYVVIQKGTHVMHLEKSRIDLYNETLHFFNDNKTISEKSNTYR